MAKVPDYDKEFKSKIRKNLEEVVSLLNAKEKGMIKKIDTFSSNFDFKPKEVESKIKKDEMFQAHFAKNPGKQNIYQNLAAEYIRKINGVNNFKILGNNSKVISNGAVAGRKEFRKMGGVDKAKTIDFEWDFNKKHFFASHKYTKAIGGGGAQVNQYNDVQIFIEQSLPSTLADTYFIAICDGDFYNGRDTISNSSRIDRLKNMANNRNVFAMRLDDLEEWLNSNFK